MSLIKNVIEKDHATFRKDYLKVMKDKYEENRKVVKDYVYKRISLDKPTYI